LPAYVSIWLLSVYFAGGYDRPVKIRNSITGLLAGTTIILVLYALLPESLRFSRALILLSSLWGIIMLPAIRFILYNLKVRWIQMGEKKNSRFIIIGDEKEAKRVLDLLKTSIIKPEFVGLVFQNDKKVANDEFIGNITQVKDIIEIYKIDEVIFCSADVKHHTIIDKMAEWQKSNIDYKIAPEDGLSIIGSNSIHTRGDLYTVGINAIGKAQNRRNKRLIDFILSLFFLVFAPVLAFIQKKPLGFIKNIFKVLFNFKTWVGYYRTNGGQLNLPKIKPSVLNPTDGLKTKNIDERVAKDLNLLYARDYNIWKDINIVFYAFRELGR